MTIFHEVACGGHCMNIGLRVHCDKQFNPNSNNVSLVHTGHYFMFRVGVGLHQGCLLSLFCSQLSWTGFLAAARESSLVASGLDFIIGNGENCTMIFTDVLVQLLRSAYVLVHLLQYLCGTEGAEL